MGNIRQRRYTIDSNGQKRELCPPIPLKGVKGVIHPDPKEIAEMDAESLRKHSEWLEIMAAGKIWARTHWCG